MSTIDPSAPAFPTGHSQSGTGLTKREYFATQIMSGHLAAMNPGGLDPGHCAVIAMDSVMAADALLAELNKETK